MSTSGSINAHYEQAGLLAAIRDGALKAGKNLNELTADDLAAVDEFHIGGRSATAALFERLDIGPGAFALDVGCGLGGTPRFASELTGCRVAGIDLTDAFVEAGNTLSDWVGLSDRVRLHTGSALAMPFDDSGFDAAWMLHVGMNIADKAALAAEVARVLRPGATFGVYDIMRTGDGDLDFPVPWASSPDDSALAPPDTYATALEGAGFVINEIRDRRDFALDFFERLRATTEKAGGPPPLGLHITMGPAAGQKYGNMVNAVTAGTISPVEIVARRP